MAYHWLTWHATALQTLGVATARAMDLPMANATARIMGTTMTRAVPAP